MLLIEAGVLVPGTTDTMVVVPATVILILRTLHMQAPPTCMHTRHTPYVQPAKASSW
jgi:hypothetical protein